MSSRWQSQSSVSIKLAGLEDFFRLQVWSALGSTVVFSWFAVKPGSRADQCWRSIGFILGEHGVAGSDCHGSIPGQSTGSVESVSPDALG
jgi:hypothetical protein